MRPLARMDLLPRAVDPRRKVFQLKEALDVLLWHPEPARMMGSLDCSQLFVF